MRSDSQRRRAVGQIVLLTAALLVLIAISASSVLLVNKSRQDNGWVVHTVEVENQLSTLLLQIRRAESSARGYLLTSEPRFLAEHDVAVANILPNVDKLAQLSGDNPVQAEAARQLRPLVESRLAEFARAVDFVKRNDTAGGVAMLREAGAGDSVRKIAEVSTAMRAEEDRLFTARTTTADRTQQLASLVTVAGSGLVIALAGISILLVRRSARARYKRAVPQGR